MDSSEQYIAMCAAAEELQLMFRKQQEAGDYVAYDKYSSAAKATNNKIKAVKIVDSAELIVYKRNEKYRNEDIWLPRQDQLQELLELSLADIRETFIMGYLGPICDGEYYSADIFKTFEQFLLAYVMQKKFNKLWNSTDKIFEKE